MLLILGFQVSCITADLKSCIMPNSDWLIPVPEMSTPTRARRRRAWSEWAVPLGRALVSGLASGPVLRLADRFLMITGSEPTQTHAILLMITNGIYTTEIISA